jgi:hypothetical protein
MSGIWNFSPTIKPRFVVPPDTQIKALNVCPGRRRRTLPVTRPIIRMQQRSPLLAYAVRQPQGFVGQGVA